MRDIHLALSAAPGVETAGIGAYQIHDCLKGINCGDVRLRELTNALVGYVLGQGYAEYLLDADQMRQYNQIMAVAKDELRCMEAISTHDRQLANIVWGQW